MAGKKQTAVLEPQAQPQTQATQVATSPEIEAADLNVLIPQGTEQASIKIEATEMRVNRSLATKVAIISADGEKIAEGIVGRQDLIAYLFKSLNWKRAAILELMQTAYPTMAYQSVFAATAGETNEVHSPGTRPPSQGRAGDGGPTFEVIGEAGETIVLSRSDYIKHLFTVAGKPRSAIAKELHIAYGTVLSATKGLTKAANPEFDEKPVKVKKSQSKPAKAKAAKAKAEAEAEAAVQPLPEANDNQPPTANNAVESAFQPE